MDQEPPEGQAPPPSGKPGFFQNINAIVVGITGLVVAIGGLAATWERIFPPEKKQEVVAETETANAAAPAEPAALEAAPEAADPTSYTGHLYADDGKLSEDEASLAHDGEDWILTAGTTTYTYEQMAGADPGQILAYNKQYDSYLSWPIAGGNVLESTDNRKNWTRYAKVNAAE